MLNWFSLVNFRAFCWFYVAILEQMPCCWKWYYFILFFYDLYITCMWNPKTWYKRTHLQNRNRLPDIENKLRVLNRHWLNGHEFEQISEDNEGQGSLACYSPWGFKELDLTEQLNWRRQWHPTPVLLPRKSHGRRSLVGCSPWGR